MLGTLVAWRLQPPPPLESASPPVPRPTRLTAADCNGTAWPKPVTFTEEQRQQFASDGFIVLRDFLTAEVVRELVQELHHLCATWPGPMDPKFDCFRSGSWLRSDVSRDFLYHGPVGKTVSDLLQVPAVRIQEDGYFLITGKRAGQPWHTDMDQYGGVFSEFHRATRAAAVWIPLTDVNHTHGGGSIIVARGGPNTNCTGKSGHWSKRHRGLGALPDPSCEEVVNKGAVVHSFRAGDAIMWHPWMPHRTQPSSTERLSWYARIVAADAVFCNHEYRAKTGNRQARCQHRLSPGQQAHSVCFQQIHPLLADEVMERMHPSWQAPVVQPTPIGDLWYHLNCAWDRLRMIQRRGLWSPKSLDRPECID